MRVLIFLAAFCCFAVVSFAAQKPLAGYKKGFFIKSEDNEFALKIRGRLQVRYEFEALNGDNSYSYKSFFNVPRARLKLKGHAFDRHIKYGMQVDFSKGLVNLKDYYLLFALLPKCFNVQIGQFKIPVARAEINSSGKLSLVDRSIATEALGISRDIGITIQNQFEKSPTVEWVIGIFNGTGVKSRVSGTVNGGTLVGKMSNMKTLFRPAAIIRLGYNHGGIKGYSQPDFEGGDFRFAIGAGGYFAFDAPGDDKSNIRGTLDYAIKGHGFSSTGAFYIKSLQEAPGSSAHELDMIGGEAQISYLLDEFFEPVFRYALVDEQDGLTNHEFSLGFSLYFYGPSLSWHNDASLLLDKSGAGYKDNYRARSMLQLSF